MLKLPSPSDIVVAEQLLASTSLLRPVPLLPLATGKGILLPTECGARHISVWLAAENLQAIGSFKLRGAFSVLRKRVQECVSLSFFFFTDSLSPVNNVQIYLDKKKKEHRSKGL